MLIWSGFSLREPRLKYFCENFGGVISNELTEEFSYDLNTWADFNNGGLKTGEWNGISNTINLSASSFIDLPTTGQSLAMKRATKVPQVEMFEREVAQKSDEISAKTSNLSLTDGPTKTNF